MRSPSNRSTGPSWLRRAHAAVPAPRETQETGGRGDTSGNSPENLNYKPVSLEVGIGAMARGTHEGTVVTSSHNLYVTPHAAGEEVNPNAVYLGAIVQHAIPAYLGGKHFRTADALREWIAAGGEIGDVFMTDSLQASQPLPVPMPGLTNRPQEK